MATKADKKKAIRQDIIAAAGIYSRCLAGKAFLYVYGDEYFEVSFPVDHFLHLTGVETRLSAREFYKNAKRAKLSTDQFYFDARHPFANAKKKLPCLKRLPELTSDTVCVLRDMRTATIVYKLSVTNLEFTLGLTENTDKKGNKINEFFLPMSMRVEDTSVSRSNGGEVVDFIFMKDASISSYDTLLVEDRNKRIPEGIKHLLNDKILKMRSQEVDMCVAIAGLREDSRMQGVAEGRAKGKAEGRAEGESLMVSLMQKLFAAGRGAELERASADKAYRDALIKEFGLEG